jgi:dihydrofolate reductase (trimethoprim resistance protein)
MTTCHPIGDVCPETCGGSSVHVGGGVDDGGACASNNSWSVVKREVVQMKHLESIVGQLVVEFRVDWLGVVTIVTDMGVFEIFPSGSGVELVDVSEGWVKMINQMVRAVRVGPTVTKKSYDDGFAVCWKMVHLDYTRDRDTVTFKWRMVDEIAKEIDMATRFTPHPAINIGDRVRKIKGSRWQGRVVGTYSTELTPEGYAVESETERGSVQIYPAAILERLNDE